LKSGIRIEGNGEVRKLMLSHPEIRNAFGAELIAEITSALHSLANEKDLRVLIIAADGPMFCAGADVNWMRGQKDAGYDENVADAVKLFELFETLYRFPKPTIARVQGGAYGGGGGLICASDIVVMADDAVMSFSEVKLGLVPATISTFVIRKIGEGRAHELFLTGKRFDAQFAFRVGLANQVVPAEKLDEAVNLYVRELLSASPGAQTVTKELLREVPKLSLDEAKKFTAPKIAAERVSPEGQEGLNAFLEKRKPSWDTNT
jgi:methylglutaconyl-CoA hydratase